MGDCSLPLPWYHRNVELQQLTCHRRQVETHPHISACQTSTLHTIPLQAWHLHAAKLQSHRKVFPNFLSHQAHRTVLIFVPLALSQAPVYTANPWIQGQCLLELIGPTYREMARLSITKAKQKNTVTRSTATTTATNYITVGLCYQLLQFITACQTFSINKSNDC